MMTILSEEQSSIGGGDNGEEEKEEKKKEEEEEDVVRVVINPSMLQRFVGSSCTSSGYYYFHDDIPMLLPRQAKKNKKNSVMVVSMPSSSPPRNNNDEDDDEDDISSSFRDLWIRFCFQLARNQDEFNNRNWSVLCLCLSGCWLSIVGGLLLDMIQRLDDMTFVAWLMKLSTLTFFCLVLPFSFPSDSMILRCGGGEENHIVQTSTQQLVDDMSPLFAELGYHVDCCVVHDNNHRRFFYCPKAVVYVRFEKSTDDATSLLGDIPLAQAMLKMQQQARQDQIDALIEQRKEVDSQLAASSYLIFGIIRVETLDSWKQPIIILGCLLAIYYIFFCIFWFSNEFNPYY